jgi:hypothetical protein
MSQQMGRQLYGIKLQRTNTQRTTTPQTRQ